MDCYVAVSWYPKLDSNVVPICRIIKIPTKANPKKYTKHFTNEDLTEGLWVKARLKTSIRWARVILCGTNAEAQTALESVVINKQDHPPQTSPAASSTTLNFSFNGGSPPSTTANDDEDAENAENYPPHVFSAENLEAAKLVRKSLRMAHDLPDDSTLSGCAMTSQTINNHAYDPLAETVNMSPGKEIGTTNNNLAIEAAEGSEGFMGGRPPAVMGVWAERAVALVTDNVVTPKPVQPSTSRRNPRIDFQELLDMVSSPDAHLENPEMVPAPQPLLQQNNSEAATQEQQQQQQQQHPQQHLHSPFGETSGILNPTSYPLAIQHTNNNTVPSENLAAHTNQNPLIISQLQPQYHDPSSSRISLAQPPTMTRPFVPFTAAELGVIKSKTRVNYSAKLARKLFKPEERVGHNCAGLAGKQPLCVERLAYISQLAFAKYTLQDDEVFDIAWGLCIKAIDTDGRQRYK